MESALVGLLLVALVCSARAIALPADSRFDVAHVEPGKMSAIRGLYINPLPSQGVYWATVGAYDAGLNPIFQLGPLKGWDSDPIFIGQDLMDQEVVFGIDVWSDHPMNGGEFLYTLFSGPASNNAGTDGTVHVRWEQLADEYVVCFEDRLADQPDEPGKPSPKDFNDFCMQVWGIVPHAEPSH